MKLRWRFGIIAGLFLAVFSLYPQMKMLYLRGADWNGHYAYNDIDEVAYASYLNALIDGRPRKNDPYTGRDDTSENPQPESLFSIQFAGPYTIAIPARILGIDAPWAMTISGAVAAFLTALAIFWLIGMLTRDSLFAMAGSLVVLAGGAIFAGEGAIGEITGWSYAYPYFPGFRRYIPAMAFPAFFVLFALIWKLITDPKVSMAFVAGSIFAFAFTVFSYFYVWTTAAAWLGCLVLCLLIARPEGVWQDIRRLALVAVGCLMSLVPYAYLLSQRVDTMDNVQLLVRTRAPDLFRLPELIAYVVLIVIAGAVLAKMISIRGRSTLFAISLALTPIVIFNQQIITGQSLQPIHYQVFIGNYVAGLALLVTLGLLWKPAFERGLQSARIGAIALATVAVIWGFVECHYTVEILDDVNIARDEAFPVARRLAELGASDPNRHGRVVLHMAMAEADDLPTVAPQSVLWTRHQHVFAGVTWDENKQRYYQLLYYQGTSPRSLSEGMKRGGDFVSIIALFGWGRHTDRLNAAHEPLTFGEIDQEVQRYADYTATLDSSNAVPLDYLVVYSDGEQSMPNLDKWYEREADEVYGKYTLYKLKLR